ncbi:WD repeat-containing protein 43 [Mangifera indica]|uniref:WD repeat-containing protein 43 n=1 Tax=Mangifera indica TaxID=29780 RepID=UPI001CFB8941|nr:WD repeat-containing protein 43 [Mangifera indica]
MASSNIRDILTSFSPSLDYFAICAGDARIKIWDTLKGQVQTEFADIASTEMSSLYANKPERGHLSVDYTCMKWLALDRKKKRKLGSSLLVLGTGSGSVLALDVAAGQLKWRISDCHPGGVSAVSFAAHGSCIYSAGADGMICEIDSLTGNLLEKFRASTKGISCMAVSPDGKMLATAAGQLKTFNCSDHKKTQKFSGHPGAVRFMMFTEDGKYILSSAVGERYIALWRTDGGKKQSASCVLSMEHPAVFIDGKCIDSGEVDDAGLYVLAISETGVCYFWYGHNIDELRNTKATKISISSEDILSQNQKGAFPAIFAAKLQGIAKPASAHAFVAHGLLVKPSFQKIVVHSGTDLSLHGSQDGVLLPMSQSVIKSKKGLDVRNRVTALDRAYAEDAVLPLPKILDVHEKKNRHQTLITDPGEVMADSLDSKSQPKFVESKGDTVEMETESEIICMEDRLRSLGILSGKDDPRLNLALKSTLFNGIDLESNIPEKKMRVAVLSMSPSNACELLEVLVNMWQSRSDRGKHILQWIYSILVNHSHHVLSQKSLNPMINSLYKITKSREASFQPLLQLSGRLQLIMAQIDKATGDKSQILAHDDRIDESEDEDEDVEELLYGELDNESQISRSSDEDD